jgi:hypothetical protein
MEGETIKGTLRVTSDGVQHWESGHYRSDCRLQMSLVACVLPFSIHGVFIIQAPNKYARDGIQFEAMKYSSHTVPYLPLITDVC